MIFFHLYHRCSFQFPEGPHRGRPSNAIRELFEGQPYNTLLLGPLQRRDLKLLLTCEAANNNLTLPTSVVVMIDMNCEWNSEISRLDFWYNLDGVQNRLIIVYFPSCWMNSTDFTCWLLLIWTQIRVQIKFSKAQMLYIFLLWTHKCYYIYF